MKRFCEPFSLLPFENVRQSPKEDDFVDDSIIPSGLVIKLSLSLAYVSVVLSGSCEAIEIWALLSLFRRMNVRSPVRVARGTLGSCLSVSSATPPFLRPKYRKLYDGLCILSLYLCRSLCRTKKVRYAVSDAIRMATAASRYCQKSSYGISMAT